MKVNKMDIIKAYRRGSREAALEDSNGFKSDHKIHEDKSKYKRKPKHKKDFGE